MERIKTLLKLFLIFFKIGLFTFGGGYAMISVIERELVEKKEWIDKDEFLDIIAIAESTPGPIAINSATYIGYKVGKFFGSVFATIGVVLPSFIIISLLAFFINRFNLLDIEYVSYAFKGINACVAFLILSAGIKLLRKQKKNIFNIIATFLTITLLVMFGLFNISFSTIYFILIGGFISVLIYIICFVINKKKGGKE